MTESLLMGCIIGVALAQGLGYFWLDKKEIRFPKWIILLILIVAQIFVFPQILFSALSYGKNGCGMPIFGLLFYCVVVGGGLNCIVHSTYYLKFRSSSKKVL